MKIFSAFAITVLVLVTTACGSGNTDSNQYSGTIEAAGITSYQYGTHRLMAGEDVFALKSDSIDLVNYEGTNVIITAEKIEGYPVDGGPVYLNVTKIKER